MIDKDNISYLFIDMILNPNPSDSFVDYFQNTIQSDKVFGAQLNSYIYHAINSSRCSIDELFENPPKIYEILKIFGGYEMSITKLSMYENVCNMYLKNMTIIKYYRSSESVVRAELSGVKITEISEESFKNHVNSFISSIDPDKFPINTTRYLIISFINVIEYNNPIGNFCIINKNMYDIDRQNDFAACCMVNELNDIFGTDYTVDSFYDKYYEEDDDSDDIDN